MKFFTRSLLIISIAALAALPAAAADTGPAGTGVSELPGLHACWKSSPIVPRSGMIFSEDIDGDGHTDFIFAPAHAGELSGAPRSLAYQSPPLPPRYIGQSAPAHDSEGFSGRSYTAGGVLAASYSFGLAGSLIAYSVATHKLTQGKAFNQINALNGLTGKPLWTFKRDKMITGTRWVSDSMLLAGCADHSLYALNPKTGKQQWTAPLGGLPVQLLESGGITVAAVVGKGDSIDHLSAFRTKTGEKIWTRPTELNRWDTFETIAWVLDEKLYVRTRDKELLCLSLTTGDSLWTYQGKSPIQISAISDTFLLALDGKELVQVRLEDGKVNWTYKTKGLSYVWGDSERLVYSTGNPMIRKGLLVLDARTGELLKKEKFWGRALIPLQEGALGLLRTSESISLYEIPSLQKRWEIPMDDVSGVFYTGFMMDEHIYIQFRKNIGVLDALTGKSLWATPREKGLVINTMLFGDRLYVPRMGNRVEVFTMEGKRVGHKNFRSDIYMYTYGNALFFASEDGLWKLQSEAENCNTFEKELARSSGASKSPQDTIDRAAW